jgi:predicted transcriptional regulator
VLFDEIIRDNKIKYLDNKQDYDFTSKIDGTLLGREKELEIEIITPNYHDYENITFIQSQTMGSTGMKMVLPVDAVFMKDVKMYLRINKYVRQSQSTGNRPEVKRILQEKAQQNSERRRTLVDLANKLLANSSVYLNGGLHGSGQTTEGKSKVVSVFQDLIKTVYPNLRMLGSAQFSEDTLKTVLRSRFDDLFSSDDTIPEAESEVLNLIARRKKQSDRTSLNDLRTHFSRKPFGWYQNAIWTVAARLYKRGKVEIKQDSNLLDDEEVLNALLNSSHYGNTLLEPQIAFDLNAVKALKQAYAEAFDENCPMKEAKDIAMAFKDKLKDMSNEVNLLLAQKRDYPFLNSMEEFADRMGRLSKKEYHYYLTHLSEFEDALLNTKEDLLNPVRRFMASEQKSIYDNIRTLLDGDTSNLDYVEGDEVVILRSLMHSPKPYQGNLIREAKVAKDSLTVKVLERIEEEKDRAIATIKSAIADLKGKDEFKTLESGKQALVIRPLEEEVNKLQGQKYIGNIRDTKTKVLEVLVPRQLNEMIRLATPAVPEGTLASEPMPHYINWASIKLHFPKSELRTEEDVDGYLEVLRKALKEQIKNNRRINL